MKNLFYLMGILSCLHSCKQDNMYNLVKNNHKINGYIQKGPFLKGSYVTIKELENDFSINGQTYKTTTESNSGKFSLKNTIYTEYIEIIAEGLYYNEVAGKIFSDNLTLKSLAKVEEELNTNVNVLTTLSKDRIIYLIQNKGIDFDSAKKQTEKEILNIFGITENINDFDKMDISNNEEGDAVLIAISSVLQGENNVAQLSKLLSQINLDIKEDGILDNQEIIQSLINNAGNLDIVQIRENLTNRYNTLSIPFEISRFEKYVQKLLPFMLLSNTTENNKSMLFTFNKMIDESTLNNNSITLSIADSTVVGTYHLYDDFTIEFNPTGEITPLTTYTIEINKDIKSIDGTSLLTKYTSQFKTGSYGLINHYLFSGNFNDASEHGNHAIGYNGLFTNDRFNNSNQAYHLNNYGDYVDIPISFSIRNSDWTYSIWFKLNSLPSVKDDVYLLSRKNAGTDSDVLLYVDNEDNAIKVGIVNDESKVSSGVSVNLNTWYFASIAVSQEGIKIYVNGQLTKTTPKRFTDNLSLNENLTISPIKYTSTSIWGNPDVEYAKVLGVIDDVRIYEKCLNEDEINTIYTNELNSTSKFTKTIKVNKTLDFKKSSQTDW